MPRRIIYDSVMNFHQPEKGYRFSADSISLADFVDLSGVRRAADLGAGCGVVGLAALENIRRRGNLQAGPAETDVGTHARAVDKRPLTGYLSQPGRDINDRAAFEAGALSIPTDGGSPNPALHCLGLGPDVFYFIEREAELLESLAKNLALYQPRTSCRLEIHAGDWRDISADDLGGALDYIMVNPPYFKVPDSRPSTRPSIDAARREIFGGLPELLASISRLLSHSGQAALILPAFRSREIQEASKQCGLTIETVRPVSNLASSPLLWLFSI